MIALGGQSFSYEPKEFLLSYENLRKKICDGTITLPKNDNRNRDVSSDKMIVASIQLETMMATEGGGSAQATDFLNRALNAVQQAVVREKANLVLLQELFLGPYFVRVRKQLCLDLQRLILKREMHLFQ